jgi:pimeloyl-ACP methyl ester carboxylesterase
MRAIGLAVVLVAWVLLAAPQAEAQTETLAGYGIVLLHGKGGGPSGYVASLGVALREAGAKVVTPRMAWAGTQGQPDKYDVPYEQALSDIGPAIEQLRAQGATKIVVAGQSLGANAAIAYAARHGNGLTAVVALAPGHTPERAVFKARVADGVARAKELVAAGRGSTMGSYPDLNCGRSLTVKATAQAYLSFFDPQGPASIPRNAAAMPAIPLLWVLGRNDQCSPAGRAYAFDRAAKHPKSRYLEVGGDHFQTPNVARRDVIAWLAAL